MDFEPTSSAEVVEFSTQKMATIVPNLSSQTKTEFQKNEKIVINVSGQKFITTFTTLLKYPTTRLGKLASDKLRAQSYFFESDADIFKELLKFYYTDKLHCPKNVCFTDFIGHLSFWEIDVKHLSDCCSQTVKQETNLQKQFQFFNRQVSLDSGHQSRCKIFSFDVWTFLTDPYGTETRWRLGSKIWMVCYLLITLFSGITISIQSVLYIWAPYNDNQTVVNLNNEVPKTQALAKTCYDYFGWRNSQAFEDVAEANIFLVVFYVTEISTRFFSCPKKSFFWKSIHGVDLMITCVDGIVYGYFAFIIFMLVPNLSSFENADKYCVAAGYLELAVIAIGQMRFLRLLSYASVYR